LLISESRNYGIGLFQRMIKKRNQKKKKGQRKNDFGINGIERL
jgi:hypothetical protein